MQRPRRVRKGRDEQRDEGEPEKGKEGWKLSLKRMRKVMMTIETESEKRN